MSLLAAMPFVDTDGAIVKRSRIIRLNVGYSAMFRWQQIFMSKGVKILLRLDLA
jgi:hypothetical protein